MAAKVTGGGTSAVASSSHAACARFRGTDPIITGRSRRKLATDVGFADNSGKIPEARWLRAATFERLVRDEKFASEVATTAVGRLDLARPESVAIVHAGTNVDTTAAILAAAHDRAIAGNVATMIYQLAIPFVGFESDVATPVLPDFAVVARKVPNERDGDVDGSWLIMGDAKDYERVRSRIDDGRLLKGFLQVALGAESAASWSQLPPSMDVHQWGVLAVPRNSFLQPEALVEDLTDHREEVRLRVAERRAEAEGQQFDPATEIVDFVQHLEATFDPGTCTTCTLFSFCRSELRNSSDPTALLIELGVPRDVRPHAAGLVDGTGEVGPLERSLQALIAATVDGVAERTGQFRIDPIGNPGTVNVVLAKSDSAALGVHGVAVQRITADGPTEWKATAFDNPMGADTRRSLMTILGKELVAALAEMRRLNPESPDPIHLVVPEKGTADLLVSIADNMAGIELSRLRWQRDKEMGRPTLTFNGEPAEVPPTLREVQRTAVSFLLEEDRARTFQLRTPIVDARTVLARHVIPGGPAVSAYRLDYQVAWAQATHERPIDHRALSDEIEGLVHTPGARLGNKRSDEIHRAYVGDGTAKVRPAHPAEYERLVLDELAYKQAVLTAAIEVLAEVPVSNLAMLHRKAEGKAQEIWYRRLTFRASDLVRFGRTNRQWRRKLVDVVEADDKAVRQLRALGNPQVATDAAQDAGTRELAIATVVSVDPLVLDIKSRKIVHESRIVLLHRNGEPCIEEPGVGFDRYGKITGMAIGPLSADGHDEPRRFTWTPANVPPVEVGDELVVADFAWLGNYARNTAMAVAEFKFDENQAPKASCEFGSWGDDPVGHAWCCRPHDDIEAEWSDTLAERRKNGQLNPQVWPPIVDADAFDVAPTGVAQGDPGAAAPEPVPDNLTIDDLD